MNAGALRHALELVTNVVLLIVCVVIVFVLAGGNIARSTRNVSSAWQSGDQFPNVPALSTKSQTLVLALSARCGFCEASIPFYERLASANTVGSVRIVAVLPESDSEARGFVKRISSDLTAVTNQDFRDLRIEGTPTLILLDSKRKVQKVWTGKLSSDQEREVLTAVQHSGT